MKARMLILASAVVAFAAPAAGTATMLPIAQSNEVANADAPPVEPGPAVEQASDPNACVTIQLTPPVAEPDDRPTPDLLGPTACPSAAQTVPGPPPRPAG